MHVRHNHNINNGLQMQIMQLPVPAYQELKFIVIIILSRENKENKEKRRLIIMIYSVHIGKLPLKPPACIHPDRFEPISILIDYTDIIGSWYSLTFSLGQSRYFLGSSGAMIHKRTRTRVHTHIFYSCRVSYSYIYTHALSSMSISAATPPANMNTK